MTVSTPSVAKSFHQADIKEPPPFGSVLALGGAKTAQYTRTASQTQGLQTALGNEVSFGASYAARVHGF